MQKKIIETIIEDQIIKAELISFLKMTFELSRIYYSYYQNNMIESRGRINIF